ncbi:MAG: asparagine synthase (glutamine-hydrolyzing) [Chitinophagaceae bacterium]|nr:asparagine synthase (glutamine-hydrolyzing) [Chitinophagaceae bacterium]
MCGFGGVINHYKPLHKAEVGKIASLVNFRGPDSCGVRVFDSSLSNSESGNTAIFFNRLAIIDLDDRSNQPFEDDAHVLMFNGEIYNYHELKASLQGENVQFRTTSDTEVLFYALKKWGTNALERLNGMFAFFWLNKKDNTFLVARDRLGIKPLYYYQENGAFYFSSELHSIIRLMKETPTISTAAVEMYLWMQFVPTPHSIFEKIAKLPPGSYIAGSLRSVSTFTPQPYWDAYEFTGSEHPQHESLEELLVDSIKRQMQADVPLGLFLSSGVDSSLLAAIVNKYFANSNDVNFFTISFQEATATDESGDAIDFINAFGNPHLKNHLLKVDPGYLQDQINNLYDYYDEPFGDYASILNWAISRKARDYVTVAISGDGADELFWGYERYNKWQELQKINSIRGISNTISRTAELFPQTTTARRIRKAFVHDPVQRHFDLFLLPAFQQYFIKKPITSNNLWALENIEKVKNRKDLPAVMDIKTYLADAMLYKVDRSSMATSLEVRVPYLDNKVLEYALQLDLRKKSNSLFKNKAPLKELLIKLAPQYNANKPKKGFSFPLSKWLRENWRNQVNDIVTANTLIEVGLEPKYFLSIVKNFYENQTNSSVEVWYLFNLALWKQHLNNMMRNNNE